MNGINILKGIVDLLVQGIMLVIYVPKTLYKILKDPEWVPQFISKESLKKDDNQDYVSPVFLYILSTLVPFALVPIEVLNTNNDKYGTFLEFLQADNTLIRAGIFIGIPMIVAFLTTLFKSTSFSRTSLEQNFYIQCYYFAPLVFMIQLRWVLEEISIKIDYLHYFLVPFISITAIWLILVLINFLMKTLEGRIKNVIAVMLLSIILIFLITDHIGLKIAKKLCFNIEMEWGIIIVLFISITTLYSVALINRYLAWKKRKTKN